MKQSIVEYLNFEECDIKNNQILYLNEVLGYMVGELAMMDADKGYDLQHENLISLSFRCLERFDKREKFEIVDYIGESAKYQNKSPGLGYVSTNNYSVRTDGHSYLWHRSPMVVLRHKKYDVLMGVDDDQYFGCKLPERCNTVKEAQDSLIPEGIRNVNYKRQGEWFIVGSEYAPQQMGYTPIITRSHMIFPLLGRNRTNESNDHMLCTYQYCWVKDDFKMNGGKDILMAYDMNLEHDQHPDVRSAGWVFFLENRAVRSFSEAGVD